MEVLQAKDLKKIYGSGNNAVHALDQKYRFWCADIIQMDTGMRT